MSFITNRNFFAKFAACGISIDHKYQNKPIQEPWKEKLKMNLMYAKEALVFTAKVFPNGALNRTDFKGDREKAQYLFLQQRNEMEQIAQKELLPQDPYEKIHEIIARVATKYQMGTCVEHAAVAYTYLKKKKNLRKVDLLTVVNGDHAFVIIGMKPTANITDSSDFGPSAVACDPWGKKYFPAEQLFDQLNKVCEEPLYDPKIHSIGWISNGAVPVEVSIRKSIYVRQKQDKTFASDLLEAVKDSSDIPSKKIKACVLDYLDQKSKPKAPPILSKTDQKMVNIYFELCLKQKQQ